MYPSFTELPTEVIQQIVLCIPTTSIPAFQQVCRRFYKVVDPLVWRQLCKSRFRYWRPEHLIKERLSGKVNDTNWKKLFVQRHLVDCVTSKTLDSILSSQTGRIEKFQRILDHGYDAKDCLLRHSEVSDEAEDVLARRFYSDAVLGCLHRIVAINEWSRIKDMEEVSLERALGAFDMFVLNERNGDLDEITERLDVIAHAIFDKIPSFNMKNPREKATLIAAQLQCYNHNISQDGVPSVDLQSNFIGISLQPEGKPSLPLVSVAVYCCVARRLGLDAAPCVFPFYVLAIIKSPPGFDLDGNRTSGGLNQDQSRSSTMYLDPLSFEPEILVEDLIARLSSVGVPHSSHQVLLQASPMSEIILRTARNIFNSVQESHRTMLTRPEDSDHNRIFMKSSFPDLESSFYSALWASLLLGIPPDGDGPIVALRRRNYLPHIVEHFETHFPTDVSLIEQYIVPLFQHTGEYAQLRESIRVMRSVDSMPKQVKRRSKDMSKHVRYQIGQVFVHKRYHYHAVITGWDVECGADERWMAQMRVHELSRGRQQSFYHVLVEDKSVRYVAEENIEPINPEQPQCLMHLAGRHFKRWDTVSRCFVSNIEDEYPQG